jgi:dTDP-4-amino-4,6-dideoxygalactose transaminase
MGARLSKNSTESTEPIPFNWPYATGNEIAFISSAQRSHELAGDGPFTKQCHRWIEQRTGCVQALLTHSCTAALEMAAMLLEIEPGDEIIMPSYTFVATACAFVLRGGVPVFVDVREDTLNLNETLVESAITPRTRAIVPVHYAGVSCEMDSILAIAKRHGLKVVEDAAHGVGASYKGRALGAIGNLGTFSFHETKNVHSGEGGCLLVNDLGMVPRAEIIWQKGTNRSQFFRGEVDKYSWHDIGSSFLPSDVIAAFLWAQLEQADCITADRMAVWQRYHEMMAPLERQGLLRRPIIPDNCQHNAHMYYLLLAEEIDRQAVLDTFRQNRIGVIFHYVPLHSSPAGLRYGRSHGDLTLTTRLSLRLIRLPLWIGLRPHQQERVFDVLRRALAC